MKIKARDGILLRDPVTKNHLPPEGAIVDPGNLFWARRVRDGDAVIVEDEPKETDHQGDNQ